MWICQFSRVENSKFENLNKDKHQNNKESEPKDACITVTKDVKYFCPTGYDEGIFSAVKKLLSEKIKWAKWSGSSDAKTINAIECENL